MHLCIYRLYIVYPGCILTDPHNQATPVFYQWFCWLYASPFDTPWWPCSFGFSVCPSWSTCAWRTWYMALKTEESHSIQPATRKPSQHICKWFLLQLLQPTCRQAAQIRTTPLVWYWDAQMLPWDLVARNQEWRSHQGISLTVMHHDHE